MNDNIALSKAAALTSPLGAAPEHLTPNQRAWRRFRRHRGAIISVVFLGCLLLLVVLWPAISRYNSEELSAAQFQPPDRAHWCGTDVHGRDLLARIVIGARVSLLVGGVGAGVSLVIGVLWGAIAGYAGGRTDEWMMRLVDILYSLPSIIFVVVLITTLEVFFKTWLTKIFGLSAGSHVRMIFLFVGLGAVSWLNMARIVRGQVLSLRHRPFVEKKNHS